MSMTEFLELFQPMQEETPCKICGEPTVKHIIKEGARYHVTSWDYAGAHCSEPKCEKNHYHRPVREFSVTDGR